MKNMLIDHYALCWQLCPDGIPFETNTSTLFPCIYKDKRAILKIPKTDEEVRSIQLMRYWSGVGAARVLQTDGNAILLERVENDEGTTLKKMVAQGADTQATRIICQVASLLHTFETEKLPPLIPLNQWFEPLVGSVHFSNEFLTISASIANSLLLEQIEICVLHGDLHHDNILLSDDRGWLAIDPKGLYGDRAFDFANILCNPNKALALEDGRLLHHLKIISQETGIETSRMLEWVIAWTGLSAIWMEEDYLDASLPLSLGQLALKLKK